MSSEAIGCGAARQQRRHAGEWLGSQTAGSAGRWAMAESFRTTCTAPLQPLADRALADAHGRSDLALGPALLCEMPGL